ncbi:MAG TPA: tetratricopeptide repeat protein [Terriglobia bacterium]|nr:tetratricopeptide repeat protein [Terriglobia bacterium]
MRWLQAGGSILLACCAALAAPRPASLGGQVTNSRGAALAGAHVTATDSLGKIFSATSDAHGTYRIAVIPAGAYTLRVQCGGYAESVKSNVRVRSGNPVQLNFVLHRNPGIKPPPNAALGAVSFYENSGLRSGQLKDPSAGGGYSDQAAVHSRTMVDQYLANPPARGASIGNHLGGDAANVGSVDAGSAWLAKRDFARAVQAFRRALIRDPASARLKMGLGIALYGQGQYDQAVEAFSKAVRLNPGDPRAYLLLSEADRATGHRNPEVRKLLKQFVEDYPLSAKAHYAYGMDLLKVPNPAMRIHARSELEKAAALDPGDAAAHLQLGIIYDHEKLTRRAIREYQSAVRLNPTLASAHYRLAQDYFRSGAEEKGQAELRAYEKLRHSKPDGDAPE